MNKVKILSTSSYHPKGALTNGQLSKMVDTNDRWILERTGIRERRVSDPRGGEWPSDLATQAAARALAEINMGPNEIDCLICATMTPDFIVPSVSCLVQKKLNMSNNCAAFDLNAACSGYLYAFNTATAYIKSGLFRNILIIGVDCMSSIVDYQDRNSCIIFGDGAGVAILTAQETGDSDILAISMGADSDKELCLVIKNGGSAHPITKENIDDREHFLKMRGKEIFKYAVKMMVQASREAVAQAGLSLGDITWMVPHQANKRILETVAQRLDFPMQKMVVNIEKFGNTTAATIPTCFDGAVREGRIRRGDRVLFTAFGGGFIWGATVFRY